MLDLWRARTFHLKQQLDQPAIAGVGARTVASFEVLDQAAVFPAGIGSEQDGKVRRLARARQNVAQFFGEQ